MIGSRVRPGAFSYLCFPEWGSAAAAAKSNACLPDPDRRLCHQRTVRPGATGFTLIFGVSGVLNLSHGAIMVLAAVAAWAAASVLHFGSYSGALVGVAAALVAAFATYFAVVQPIQKSTRIPNEEKEIFVLTGTLLSGEHDSGTDHGQSADDDAALDADLVVRDGVGSRLRARHADRFGPTITTGRNRYIWLGTSKVLEAFTFAFERTDAAWAWAYGYPSTGGTSTFVIECAPATWTGLGLDRMDPDAGLRLLESVFARVLSGHRLLEPPTTTGCSPWLHFREIRNATWRAGNLVLAGDAAHTTHFGIGSGTVLAVQDAIALADAVHAPGAHLPDALDAYDRRRRAAIGPIQDMAMRSMSWFEDVDKRMDGDPVRIASACSTAAASSLNGAPIANANCPTRTWSLSPSWTTGKFFASILMTAMSVFSSAPTTRAEYSRPSCNLTSILSASSMTCTLVKI